MSSYTFIANFKGGIFVRQVSAKNVLIACRIWADELAHKRDIPDLNVPKFLKDFNNDLEHLPPAPLQNTPNVWCFTVGTGRNFILVNIVKTSSEKEPALQNVSLTAAGSIR